MHSKFSVNLCVASVTLCVKKNNRLHRVTQRITTCPDLSGEFHRESYYYLFLRRTGFTFAFPSILKYGSAP